MPIKDQSIHPPPEKADGEGWLANADLQKIVQFKPDVPTAHGQWERHVLHRRQSKKRNGLGSPQQKETTRKPDGGPRL